MKLLDLMGGPSPQLSESSRIQGVVMGIVTNNQDPEQLGRIKVRFPWLNDSDESTWARMAHLMAGPDRGSLYLPEVDDEVLLAFEHGDVRCPYILGMLYNGVDKPTYTNADGKNNIRAIRSRSHHELIFDDNASEKKEKVVLHSNPFPNNSPMKTMKSSANMYYVAWNAASY